MKGSMMDSMNENDATYKQSLAQLKAAIDTADAILAGAGSGLSTAAGFTYAGERFRQHFGDFEAKYDFHDMYSGGFFPFETPEEQWAYWARNIIVNRFMPAPKDTYQKLLDILDGKNFFVITTNVDHQFQTAGFPKERLFYTQGDYGLWQCSEPCHDSTYDNEDAVRAMYEQERDMRIPSDLIPRCPRCGKPMAMNLRADSTFVEDAGWHAASQRYSSFVEGLNEGKALFLELGVGWNTPGVIKFPFWRMTYCNPESTFAVVNLGEAVTQPEIAQRSIVIDADINAVLKDLHA